MADFSGHRDWDQVRFVGEFRRWAAQGERQDIEFKEALPAQIRDFGKEIAAFATSNDGVILLGVTDTGDLEGLAALATPQGRAVVQQRLEGLVSSSVKPSVTPLLRFLEIDGRGFAAIVVEKGAQPVYYASGVPYVRQITAARPATPEEVIELILRWRDAGQGDEATTAFFSNLLDLLVELMTDAADGTSPTRLYGGWLDALQVRFGHFAEVARDLSARAPEAREGLEDDLVGLAECLEAVATQHLTMESGWTELETGIVRAGELAQQFKSRWFSDVLNANTTRQIDEAVRVMAKTLRQLATRAPALMDQPGGMGTLKDGAGRHGKELLKAAQFGVGLGGPDGRARLAAVGKALREAETQELYLDGGASARAIVEAVVGASQALDELLDLARTDAAGTP